MTLTLDDYWRAVDSFVAAMGRPGDDVRGILLRGSLARDEVVLGQSDLLDAVVVVRSGLLQEPAAFHRVVQQILTACAPLTASGVPFAHPPNLFQEEELGDFDATFGPSLVAPDASRNLMGEDLRPLVRWSDSGQVVARCAFFSIRRRFMDRLAVLLPPLRLSAQQQSLLFDRLVDLSKTFPVIACAALGRPASQKHALTQLRHDLPELDFSPFDEITARRKGEQSRGGPEELQGLLRSTFDLTERIEERILAAATACWSELLATGAEPRARA